MLTKSRKIYVASSWRNPIQEQIVCALRNAGHEVYDFKNPAPGHKGFAWSDIDRDWLNWSPVRFIKALTHSIAVGGFKFDKAALEWCDTCILVLPCGRSAHLELGYAAGQGKDTYVLLNDEKFEPELMYLLNDSCATSIEEIIDMMAERQPGDIERWHRENGGKFTNPAGHALRLLREVIELCVASGAAEEQIYQALIAECEKASSRGEFGGDPDTIPEEWADCAILLEIYAKHAGINKKKVVRDKLDVLWVRKWQADEDGVLWRPGTKQVETV